MSLSSFLSAPGAKYERPAIQCATLPSKLLPHYVYNHSSYLGDTLGKRRGTFFQLSKEMYTPRKESHKQPFCYKITGCCFLLTSRIVVAPYLEKLSRQENTAALNDTLNNFFLHRHPPTSYFNDSSHTCTQCLSPSYIRHFNSPLLIR